MTRAPGEFTLVRKPPRERRDWLFLCWPVLIAGVAFLVSSLWVALPLGLFLAMAVVAKQFHYVKIRVAREKLRATTGPLPWPTWTWLPAGEIRDFGVEVRKKSFDWNVSASRRSSTTLTEICLVAKLKEKERTVKLAEGFEDTDEANYVSDKLDRELFALRDGQAE